MEQLKSGDIVLRLPVIAPSLAIASSTMSAYSHCGIVARNGDKQCVVDCYPYIKDGLEGGVRRTPIWDWLVGEGRYDIYHWVALRNKINEHEIDSCALLDRFKELNFSLTPLNYCASDGSSGRLNCSDFLNAVLCECEISTRDVVVLGEISYRAFEIFFSIIENKVASSFLEMLNSDFAKLAYEYKINECLSGELRTTPPAYAEMHPDYRVALYSGPCPRYKDAFSLWAKAYHDRIPAIRAAVHTDGLMPHEVPWSVANISGGKYCSVLGNVPREECIDGIRMCHDVLLNEVYDMMTYVRLPVGAALAGSGASQAKSSLFSMLLLLLKPSLALAQLSGLIRLPVLEKRQDRLIYKSGTADHGGQSVARGGGGILRGISKASRSADGSSTSLGH